MSNLARSRPQTDKNLAYAIPVGVKSVYKHCGSTAESNLDTATGVQPAKTGEHPALSDPVLVIGSITHMGPAGSLMPPIHSH